MKVPKRNSKWGLSLRKINQATTSVLNSKMAFTFISEFDAKIDLCIVSVLLGKIVIWPFKWLDMSLKSKLGTSSIYYRLKGHPPIGRQCLGGEKNPIKSKCNFRFVIELLIKRPKVDIASEQWFDAKTRRQISSFIFSSESSSYEWNSDVIFDLEITLLYQQFNHLP